jgi:glutaredoxin
MTSSVVIKGTPVEAYWVPGCSSCLRMKEFLEKHDVPFEAVNLAEQPERYARVRSVGLTAPAVLRGDRGVPGMDLVGIAALVGIDYVPPKILSAPELKDRYDNVNEALQRLAAQIPVEGLEYKSPDRDRSMRELIAHAGSAIQEFLHATEVEAYTYGNNNGENGAFRARFALGGQVGETGTREELVEYVGQMKTEFVTWWETMGYDDPLDRVVGTPFGHVTLHEILERGVWHTAQHTRQVQYFLRDRLGVDVREPLTADHLRGLPLPEGIHA